MQDGALRCRGTCGQTAGDEQLEVRFRLHRGQALVEQIELVEGALVARPTQFVRYVERGEGTVREDGEALPEPLLVVTE